MDPELEKLLRQVELGQMSPEQFQYATGMTLGDAIQKEAMQGQAGRRTSPEPYTDGYQPSGRYNTSAGFHSPSQIDNAFGTHSQTGNYTSPQNYNADFASNDVGGYQPLGADYNPNWRDRRKDRKQAEQDMEWDNKESYIERRMEEAKGDGTGKATNSYENLAKEYDELQKGSSTTGNKGMLDLLNHPGYMPMDLESRFHMAGNVYGSGKKGSKALGTAGVLSGTLGGARSFLSGYHEQKRSKENYLESQERARGRGTRYTDTSKPHLDLTGGWYGQDGGEYISPAQRFQQLFEEGGEMMPPQEGQMPPQEQMPQEGQMPPQEQMPQEGGQPPIGEEEIMVIAQQLMQEFQSIEEMQQYLTEQGLPPELVEHILQAVSMMAQEQPQQGQQEELPKSQVMRDTMSGDMGVDMGFAYGGRYPKLR